MTHRLAKKYAARFAAAYSLSLCLDHAKPSFYQLRDIGRQRKYLRHRLARLDVRGDLARYTTHRWLP